MLWMPERSVRMKRLTFGFHRRVWCPKWTPLSSSWRMVTTAMAVLLLSRARQSRPAVFSVVCRDRPAAIPGAPAQHPPPRSRRTEGCGPCAMGTRSHPRDAGADVSVAARLYTRAPRVYADAARMARGSVREGELDAHRLCRASRPDP